MTRMTRMIRIGLIPVMRKVLRARAITSVFLGRGGWISFLSGNGYRGEMIFGFLGFFWRGGGFATGVSVSPKREK